jgi:hypothetical protein
MNLLLAATVAAEQVHTSVAGAYKPCNCHHQSISVSGARYDLLRSLPTIFVAAVWLRGTAIVVRVATVAHHRRVDMVYPCWHASQEAHRGHPTNLHRDTRPDRTGQPTRRLRLHGNRAKPMTTECRVRVVTFLDRFMHGCHATARTQKIQQRRRIGDRLHTQTGTQEANKKVQ